MTIHHDTEVYASLVRTSPDLSGWSVPTLLAEYGALAVRQREAVQLDAPELDDIEQDMAAIADEIESMTIPSTGERDVTDMLAELARDLQAVKTRLFARVERLEARR